MMRNTSLILLSAAAGAALTVMTVQPRIVFDGSSAKAVAALLGGEAARVSDEELDRIAKLVKDARSDAR